MSLDIASATSRLMTPPRVVAGPSLTVGGPIERIRLYDETFEIQADMDVVQRQKGEGYTQGFFRVGADGTVEAVLHPPPGRQYATFPRAQADGGQTFLGWTTVTRLEFDGMVTGWYVSYNHDNIQYLSIRPDGSPGWTRSVPKEHYCGTPEPSTLPPLPLSDGATLIVANKRTIECVEGAGDTRWSRDLGGFATLSVEPVEHPSGLLLVTENRHGTLHALNPADGHDLWTFEPGVLACEPAVLSNGRIGVVSPSDGLHYLTADGQADGHVPLKGFHGVAEHPDGSLIVAGREKIIGLRNGHVRWEQPLEAPSVGHPRVHADGRIDVALKSGVIQSYRIEDPIYTDLPDHRRDPGALEVKDAWIVVDGVRIDRRS